MKVSNSANVWMFLSTNSISSPDSNSYFIGYSINSLMTRIDILLGNKAKVFWECSILSSSMGWMSSGMQISAPFAHFQWPNTSSPEITVLRSLSIAFYTFAALEVFCYSKWAAYLDSKHLYPNGEVSMLCAFGFVSCACHTATAVSLHETCFDIVEHRCKPVSPGVRQ